MLLDLTSRKTTQDETAIHPELQTAGLTPILTSKPSLDTLASSATSSVAPVLPRPRSKSIPRDDLTSPRIANLGLGMTPTSPVQSSAPGLGAWVDGKEVPHGSPILDQELEDAVEIDEGFTACTSSCLLLAVSLQKDRNKDADHQPPLGSLFTLLQPTQQNKSRQNWQHCTARSNAALTCETSTCD